MKVSKVQVKSRSNIPERLQKAAIAKGQGGRTPERENGRRAKIIHAEGRVPSLAKKNSLDPPKFLGKKTQAFRRIPVFGLPAKL